MRLAPRLTLAFAFLAGLTTASLGYVLRHDRHQAEAERFEKEVRRACDSVSEELARQAERDVKLIGGACREGVLVSQVSSAIDRGDLGSLRFGFSQIVPHERVAFDMDELLLSADGGDIIGADPKPLYGMPRKEVDLLLFADETGFSLRTRERKAIVSRCVVSGTRKVGLAGVRHVDPMLARLARTLDVRVNPPDGSAALPLASSRRLLFPSGSFSPEPARAECSFRDPKGVVLPIVVTKPKTELVETLRKVDESILVWGAASLGVAFLFGIVLARSLGRPLAILADEAGKVAEGQARPLTVRGSREIKDLGLAFNRMIEDLAVTRRRLAATTRVAAWREVARRVAHEVKNPLAPIRAAVETLRRLRARDDPAFDDYFDEATRTVLDEVHRIANIVTEFTRFARLPSPRPEEVDLEEIVRHVLAVHKAAAGTVALDHAVRSAPPKIRADRDQIVQILTNLVQNGLDACRDTPGAHVRVVLDHDGHGRVTAQVTDDGPGISKDIAARLFEPYATTKSNGTGLGLAIAQRIAIEHNGELSYVGANGPRGAIFRLVLPVEGPPPASEGAPTSG